MSKKRIIQTDGGMVDINTGEIIDGEIGYFISDEDRKKIKNNIIQKELKERVLSDGRKADTFTWLLFHIGEVLDIGVPPESFTKIVFLSTYLNYKNELMNDNSSYMTKKQMQTKLKLSINTFNSFFNLITSIGILEYNGEVFVMNKDIFLRGKVGLKQIKKERDENVWRTRIFRNSVRQIYEQTDIRKHKAIAQCFSLIPFTHFVSNIICTNPQETDFSAIDPIDVKDIATMLGYDKKHWRRIITDLNDIKFNNSSVVMYITKDLKKHAMFLNPTIFSAKDYIVDDIKINNVLANNMLQNRIDEFGTSNTGLKEVGNSDEGLTLTEGILFGAVNNM